MDGWMPNKWSGSGGFYSRARRNPSGAATLRPYQSSSIRIPRRRALLVPIAGRILRALPQIHCIVQFLLSAEAFSGLEKRTQFLPSFLSSSKPY
jgi:hypothetical protein